jgi:hypothetical protein
MAYVYNNCGGKWHKFTTTVEVNDISLNNCGDKWHKLELIYLYFPPSFHLIIVVSVL